jgi:DNA polymerase-4
VEPFGPDEAWLDVTNSLQLFGSAQAVAVEVSESIKRELGVTISVGVSWNKIFAKFGSNYKKPDAITAITHENYRDIVWQAPVRALLYVGQATERKLADMGIRTIGELAAEPPEHLRRRFGVVGLTLSTFARGEDRSPVKPYDPERQEVNRAIKSYGNGLTAPHDIVDAHDAKALIYLLAESVSQRMREDDARANTVSIWIRYATLDGCTRQTRLPVATNATSLIARAAWELLVTNEPLDDTQPIRALAVRASDLETSNAAKQLSLFETDHHRELEELDATIDVLRKRYGNTIVQRGIELYDESLDGVDIKRENIVRPRGVFNG